MGNESSLCCYNPETQKFPELTSSTNLSLQNQDDLYEIIYQHAKLTYKGQLKDGLPHGKGIQLHSNGDVYEGDFVNGVKIGTGTYTFANGNKYYGQFLNNTMEGRGFILFANGDSYDGEFKNNQMDGYGVYRNKSDRSEFRGCYCKGKKHGQGVLIFNGVSHRGNWNNGVYYFY